MANTTIEELLNLAYEVRDADQAGENTALRVGGLLEEIIQYLSTVVGLDTLQAILAEYATVTGNGVIHWRQSRIVCLASMGYDLDNIDGGNWNYTNSNGDIVFNPSRGGFLNVVGTTGEYSVLQNVVYVNNHTGHAYLWKLDGNTYKMVEIRDSSPTTIITYLNTPPFSQVAVGESYFYTSGSTRKIAIKLSSDEAYSFDPNPKKIYVFLDTKQVMVWNSGNRQWISVGGNLIQIINDLTTGGEDAALSAEMGKVLDERLTDVEENGTVGGVSVDYDATHHRIVFGEAAVMERIIVSPLLLVFQDTESGSSKTKTFTVKGVNLSAGISLTLTDSTGFFSLSANSISQANANSQNTITVTYAPTATGSHSASIAITSGTITKTVTVSGTAVEEVVPSLEVNGGDDIDLSAESGETVTANVHVSGNNLTPGSTVAIAASGSLSVSPASLTVDNSGEVDADVTVSWTASSSDIAETLTASSSTDNVSDSVDINGTVVAPLAEGTTFRKNDMLWTVKADGSLKVKQVSTTLPTGDIVIPATISDLGATDPVDGVTPVSGARGATYNVTEIEASGFQGSNYITSMIIREGITTIGTSAFGKEHGNKFKRLVLPASCTSLGLGNNSSDAPRDMLVFAPGFNTALVQKNFWTKCPKVVMLTRYTGTETYPSLYKGTGIYGCFLQYSDSLKYGYDSIDKTLYVLDQATKDHVLTLTNYDNFAGGVHLISELDADDQNFINSLLQ